jgi:hypothetical protein
MKESPGDDPDTSQPVQGVSMTSFLTLYCHEIDARSNHPILNDTRSIGIAAALDRMLAGSDDELSRDLLRRKIRPAVVTHVAMRARRYDEYVRNFLALSPDGVVVNIGCGLDPRFIRIDNGTVQYGASCPPIFSRNHPLNLIIPIITITMMASITAPSNPNINQPTRNATTESIPSIPQFTVIAIILPSFSMIL